MADAIQPFRFILVQDNLPLFFLDGPLECLRDRVGKGTGPLDPLEQGQEKVYYRVHVF